LSAPIEKDLSKNPPKVRKVPFGAFGRRFSIRATTNAGGKRGTEVGAGKGRKERRVIVPIAGGGMLII